MTPCTNAHCAIWVTCQKGGIIQNGYAAMARQEYAMRMSAIDFGGDHG